jgi:hypothetical protein
VAGWDTSRRGASETEGRRGGVEPSVRVWVRGEVEVEVEVIRGVSSCGRSPGSLSV